MVQIKKLLRGVTRLAPPSGNRIGKVHRFDRNERTTPFPEAHLKRLFNTIHPDELSAYPDLGPFSEKLANWLEVQPQNLRLWAGSDTAIRAVYEVFVEEGDEVITLSSTYGMYAVYGRMFGATTKEVLYDDDLSLPVDRIICEISERTKCIAIANPNQTGTVLQEGEILKVLEAARNVDALVVIDEAYFHFSDVTMISHIREWDNLLVIRTFSKGFGVASVRIGYTVANPELSDHLGKVALTHEITSFSASVGYYLLNNLDILEQHVKDVRTGKVVLYQRLENLGFEVPKSEGNFVFFNGGNLSSQTELVKSLEERDNIFVRGPFETSPFSGHVRVTVGTGEQMHLFCDAIARIQQPSIQQASEPENQRESL